MKTCPICGSKNYHETTHAESCDDCGYYYWYGILAATEPKP